MNVLMMHRDDGLAGGAQIQMNRLRSAMSVRGLNVRLLCRDGNLPETVRMPSRPWSERCIGAVTRRLGFNELHLLSSHDLRGLPEVKEADLLDLHCLHSGTFSYRALPELTRAKPTVFTFHDMWPLTGHCHASLDCEKWRSGCGKCPHLNVEPAVRRDSTALEWRLKHDAFQRSKFTIVVPSRWLAERVAESMLADHPLVHIPHGVDVDVFSPMDPLECRKLLGIPAGKLVLLCAIDNMDRPLKGAELLKQALHELPDELREQCFLLVFGRASHSFCGNLPVPVLNLGYLALDQLKAVAYSAADLTVNPSRAESFGLVCLESLACGTPVAAFSVGGVPELVRPGLTGGLAKADNPTDLARQIVNLLSDQARLSEMKVLARELAIDEYSLDLQVSRYIKLYGTVSGLVA